MSDFDDEPIEGEDANEAGRKPQRAPKAAKVRPEPVDDDWDDDWDDDDVRGGPRRDMTLVYAIIAAVVVIVLAIVLTRPKSDSNGENAGDGKTGTTAPVVLNWQGPVADAVGDVQTRIGKDTGVFIWTDFKGWHVRSTMDGDVTVTVTSDTIIPKGSDCVKKNNCKAEVTETIKKGDPKTGLDLDFGFSKTATFDVSVGGTAIPFNQIKLGGKGEADANPITFNKA